MILRCFSGGLMVALLLNVMPAFGTLIFEDTFEIGGNSANTGFGSDGVNTDVQSRWDGTSGVFSDPNYEWYIWNDASKDPNAYSIENNALDVSIAGGPGRVALSRNEGAGGSAYSFASDLGVGSGTALYTVEVTMGLDVDATNGARTSFMWGDNVTVNNSDIALQLKENGSDLDVFIRIDGSNHSGGDLNSLIGTLSGRAGELVDFTIDFVDNGSGVGNESDFTITAVSGPESFTVTDTDASVVPDDSFRFSGTFRTVALDTAPNEGATYDNVRITLVPEPTSLSLAILTVGCLACRRRCT